MVVALFCFFNKFFKQPQEPPSNHHKFSDLNFFLFFFSQRSRPYAPFLLQKFLKSKFSAARFYFWPKKNCFKLFLLLVLFFALAELIYFSSSPTNLFPNIFVWFTYSRHLYLFISLPL